MSKIIALNDLYENELEEFIIDLGLKKFRADQIYRAIFSKNIKTIDEITQISEYDREILKEKSYIRNLKILEVFTSKIDKTKKMLYLLEDNTLIEGVLMEYKHGYTLCVSTQVGCRMGCSFCASTVNGMERNLYPSEIVSQINEVEDYFDIRISNVVLMGSGEPLDNFDNVIKALRILNSEKGRNLSMRSFTLSTCGVAEKIVKFGEEIPQAGLAISVHSFKDEIRSEMMPVNRKYNIDYLFREIREYAKLTGNRISIEYTVIPGKNDTDEDIRLFKKYLNNLNYIVNLIALNPINEYNKIDYRQSAKIFKDKLDKNNINCTLRRELGSDISASCGQLKKYYLEEGGLSELQSSNACGSCSKK